MGQVPPGNRSMILPTEAAIEEELADLVDDDELWRHQASSLAVFVTPAAGTTFRLPNQLVAMVEVSVPGYALTTLPSGACCRDGDDALTVVTAPLIIGTGCDSTLGRTGA